jgi:hypothetical protein
MCEGPSGDRTNALYPRSWFVGLGEVDRDRERGIIIFSGNPFSLKSGWFVVAYLDGTISTEESPRVNYRKQAG